MVGSRAMRSRWLARLYEGCWRPITFAFSTGFRMPSAEQEAALVLDKIGGTRGPWLDLSSGPGNFTRRLAARAGDRALVALDSSPAMLERVRIAAPSAARVLADAAAIPFADGTFGAVVNLAALDLYSDAERVVAESARVLAPGGRWVASTFVRSSASSSLMRTIWERAAGLRTPREVDIASHAARAGLVRLESVRFGSYLIAWADKPRESAQDMQPLKR
jgi:SAM-dependent methyltransferase